MFTVMIAEDSKPILRNIRMLLESSGLPVQVTATAYNGEEALESIRRQPVDILLSDIRMPKMDGLSLIGQAKQLCPGLKAVLISSYSDFEYTRKALNLQVFDYLLKPVEPEQLKDVIGRAIASLSERQAGAAESFKGVVDSAFLAGLRLGPEFHEKPLFPFLLCRQPFAAAGSWDIGSLRSCLEEACAPAACWLFPLIGEEQHYMVLVQASVKERYESAGVWMDAVRNKLLDAGIHAAAAGSFQPLDLARLKELQKELEQRLAEELTIAGPTLVDASYRSRQPQEASGYIQGFADMIGGRQSKQFMLKLAELQQQWGSDNIRLSDTEKWLTSVADAFCQAMPEGGPEQRLAMTAAIQAMLRLDSYSRFCEAVTNWCGQNFELLQAQNRKSGEELFGQLDSHIKLHKYSQLSITDLAAKFHVSPSYISRIIKRYTNSTFVQYYMELKIEEACRQLQAKPELKIKDLSDALSFSDQHYFSRVFKEYAGCTPSEYKDRIKPDAE